MKKVGIVGGGITGLTCAYRLARAGHEVELYEKGEELGGLAGSFTHGDFIFDYGPHEFCTEDPLLIATLKDVLQDDLVIRQKHVAQYFNNNFIDYPLSPLDVIQQMGLGFTAKVGLEVIGQRLKALLWKSGDESFEQWISNRFGPTMCSTYFKPYTEKVWGINADDIDPRTASDRIAFNSVFDYLIKAAAYFVFKKNDFRSIHSPLKDKFFYSKRGIGTLSESLAKRCRELGVEFKHGYELDKVEQVGNRVEALHFTNGAVVKGCDYIVSTIPLTHLLTSMGSNPGNLPIRFRSMVFAFMEIPLPELSEYSWIYFPDKDLCFQRLTDFAHLRSDMVPQGQTGVGFEISCFPEDEIWQLSDEEITSRVHADLKKTGLLSADVKCRTHIVRRKFIYPIQVTGYLELVHQLLEPVKKLSNFVTTGRQGLYKYCNMNECMEMAIGAAEQIEQDVDTFSYELDSSWRGAGIETVRVAENVGGVQ